MKICYALFWVVTLLATAVQTHAAAPVINSAGVAAGVVGQPFSYEITTENSDAISFSHQGALPAGLTRQGALISGTPEEPGEFPLTIGATNFDGSDSQALTLTITNPVPVITSELSAEGRVGRAFSYTITATNAPTSYNALFGLLDGDLTLDPATGVISGTPTVAGDYEVIILAQNDAGSSFEVLSLIVAPDTGTGGINAVTIVSPAAGATLPGEQNEFSIQATVEPAAGEAIDTVFVQWDNPPDLPDGTPREPVVLAALSNVSDDGSGVFTYSGTVKMGFNPDDREVGGGEIDLSVIAFSTSAVDATDYTAGTLSFEIAPILEFVFPDAGLAMDSIQPGDVFASARVSSGNIDTVTARIAGESILDTITIAGAGAGFNGIYNFEATKAINFPGEYEVQIIATDANANVTEINRSVLISDSLSEPVAVVTSPTPGFTNEVFTPAIMSFVEESREIVTVNQVGVVGFDVTYRLTLVSGGQGYYPRNSSDATLLATDAANITLGVPDINVANGRIDELPDTFTVFYSNDENGDGIRDDPVPEWAQSGNALIDDLADPGFNGKIEISAQFYKANAPLEAFEIFVNGELVHFGNLDPGGGAVVVPVVVPVVKYPAVGSPDPGDYVVVAQVVDQQGEVGTSEPVAFSILPFDPIDLIFSRVENDPVSQGDSVTYEATFSNPNTLENIETVTIFDSDSEEEIGTASRTTINGEQVYRFTERFDVQGQYGRFAQAVAFNGQTARSNALTVEVEQFDDLEIEITSPSENQTIIQGESVRFSATATATPGIQSVRWIVDSVVEETDTSAAVFAFERVFSTAGTFTVRAEARDNFGNELSGEVTIEVLSPNPLLRDGDFIRDTYQRLFGRLPTSAELAEAEAVLDGTLASRISFTTGLLGDLDQTVGISMIYRTMLGVWPNAEELAESRAALLGAVGNTASESGTIDSGGTETFEFTFNAGDSVTIQVTGESLSDPTLTVNDPSGNLVAFSDDSFFGNNFSTSILDPQVVFVATQSGTYEAIVGGFSFLQAGTFTINVNTSGVGTGDLESGSGQALVESLVPEYEELFGNFPQSVVGQTQAGRDLLDQVFSNKHGVSPDGNALLRLNDALTGSGTTVGVNTSPGYNGSTSAFVAAFALDNEVDPNLFGGFSSVHFYALPNDATENALRAALVSGLLRADPTDETIASISGNSLNQIVRSILTDPDYFEQFVVNSTEGEIARYMAGFGVFDLADITPEADPDGDGDDNASEYAANTDPTDSSDFPVGAPVTAEVMVQSWMQRSGETLNTSTAQDADGDGATNLEEIALGGNPVDGSSGVSIGVDLRSGSVEPAALARTTQSFTADSGSADRTCVITFVRLKASEMTSDMKIVPYVSTDLSRWDPVDLKKTDLGLADDQSGLGPEYERVEIHLNAETEQSLFVRISVETD